MLVDQWRPMRHEFERHGDTVRVCARPDQRPLRASVHASPCSSLASIRRRRPRILRILPLKRTPAFRDFVSAAFPAADGRAGGSRVGGLSSSSSLARP